MMGFRENWLTVVALTKKIMSTREAEERRRQRGPEDNGQDHAT